MSSGKLNINITGGNSNIGNISQGNKSTLNANLNVTLLTGNQNLGQALEALKSAIDLEPNLPNVQRQAAISDLNKFAEEATKPPDKQDAEAKSFFWERLTDVVKFSTALTGLAATVAKIAGL